MSRRRFRFGSYSFIALLILVVGGSAAWIAFGRGDEASAREQPPGADAKAVRAVTVEVVSPRAGGIDRMCTQPGTVEPFQAADLYAKVSGYLGEQSVVRDGKKVRVDIGTPVLEGEVLARISAPEVDKQVAHDEADVVRVKARVDQMSAAITTARADHESATAAIAQARAEHKSKSSYRAYRETERKRILDLVEQKALEQRKADEEQDLYQAAIAAEVAANESVNAAKKKEAAAAARVEQAIADREYADAEVKVANARLEKSRELARYLEIRSPYTGVVTRRSFHVGDFVRSAESGGDRVPVLSVEQTTKMRIIVQVPDRDVPYVRPGNPAVVQIDALPGESFKTTADHRIEVSRSAASEDPHTRMMRTEVDIPNPDGKLRRGMYGRVTITLQPGLPTAVRIPSVALVGKSEGGKGMVRLVRDDVVHFVPVEYGADNGAEAEVLSGLTPADRVVVRANGPIENGTAVSIASRR